MKKTLLSISICCCMLLACNNANDAKEPVSEMPDDAVSQTTEPAATIDAAQVQTTDSSNLTVAPAGTPVITSAPAPASNAAAATTAPGMNPPHGQPGHRCEIAVGAPLNSAPAKVAPAPNSGATGANQPSISSTPTITSAQAPAINAAPATTTAPGMNPPHGQPGHDCAIAVGAPLKKK